MTDPQSPSNHPFEQLDPGLILDAVETLGLRPDGRFLELNSYENRVYQVGVEEASPVVVKFYRPGRWPDEAIREEHRFTAELAEHDVPAVAPLVFGGETLHEYRGFRFALAPRRGGRAPELDDPETRKWLGRLLGRIHAVGAVRPFEARPTIDINVATRARHYLLESGLIPGYLGEAYESLTADVLTAMEAAWERAGAVATIRLHGDCHPGNILWTDAGPHFVDLDDCRMGPAVQDLWMLLSGAREEMTVQLADVVAGYEDFCELDRRELHLVEPLRTLRIMNYAAWLAQRWHDPAFPSAFPWFGSDRFWEEHLLTLREQAAALQEPPLVV